MPQALDFTFEHAPPTDAQIAAFERIQARHDLALAHLVLESWPGARIEHKTDYGAVGSFTNYLTVTAAKIEWARSIVGAQQVAA
jgi:hypothetical protein